MTSHFPAFRKTVLDYYRKQGRHDLPWRQGKTPYAIVVSEIMLQQTQVDRVIPFYIRFVKRFPTWGSLARAQKVSVLKAWQGLGYNRRALMLQQCAQDIVSSHRGVLPDTFGLLVKLPGIGPYTAGAIMAFAFNKPYPMIETNIRRVYIHHFFPKKRVVDDADIIALVEKSMDRRHSRVWFSALMDYGSWLAGRIKNPNRQSVGYTRQSDFEGSSRQIRGRVLKILLARKKMTVSALEKAVGDARFKDILIILEREGFLVRHGKTVSCA